MVVAVAVEEKEDTARKGREVVEMAEDDDRRVGRRKRPIIVAGVVVGDGSRWVHKAKWWMVSERGPKVSK